MKRLDAVRLFGMNNLAIEAEIRRVEKEQRVDLGHVQTEKQPGDDFYVSFLRSSAMKRT